MFGLIPHLLLGLFLCSVDHLCPVCSPHPDSHSHVGKVVAAHHCKVSQFSAAKREKKGRNLTSTCLKLYLTVLLSLSSQIRKHPHREWVGQLQPKHGVLGALDHPLSTFHHLPLQEEAQESPQ